MGDVLACAKHQSEHPAEAPDPAGPPLPSGPATEALRVRLATRSPAAGDPELSAVLVALLDGVRAALGPHFVGLYLQGSLAVGDFDEDSDVDFLVAIDGALPEDRQAALGALHPRVYALDSGWAQHLEGAYVPVRDLRRYDPASPPHLFLDHGSRVLELSDHDHSVLHRSVLRERGVTLAGPDPRQLVEPIPAGALSAEARANLVTWMAPLAADPLPLERRWRQVYTVLTVCRMLHTLTEDTVVSKLAAARWAQAALDPRWSGLIDRAWADRPHSFLKARQTADPAEVQATVAFVRHALAWSGQ
jgi:hypothetical protein